MDAHAVGRRFRGTLLVAALLGLANCGDPATEPVVGPPSPIQWPLLVGADISALERIEQAGAVFRDSTGQPAEGIGLLRGVHAGLFRLRLFVAPNGSDVQVNDLAYTVRLARRIKAAGGRLLLDLHYSDTWADPGHQAVPAAWAALDPAALEAEVERYTAEALTTLVGEGVRPDFVQLGNEIDAGLLWPIGRVGGSYDTPGQWQRLAGLLQAGIRGVRTGAGPGDSVAIVIHYSGGGDAAGTQWFFDHLRAAGVPFDVIGVSYYPWWHGSLAALSANLRAAIVRYDRDVMVLETSYPWRVGGWEGMATDQSAMVWPATPAGQLQYLQELLTLVSALPDGRGVAVIWWYPEAVAVPGLFIWGGGSLALFDAGGRLLPASLAFLAR